MRAELSWIDGPWPGRIAVMPRPRAGDWLDDEMQSWRDAGASVVASLLTEEEAASLDLAGESQAARRSGMEFLSFPIVDYSVPSSRVETEVFVQRLSDRLSEGKNLVLHCRGGLGRAPLIAACLLASVGIPANLAFEKVGAARGREVPETNEQRQWVTDFAAKLSLASPVSAR